jgi:hypothetical protein
VQEPCIRALNSGKGRRNEACTTKCSTTSSTLTSQKKIHLSFHHTQDFSHTVYRTNTHTKTHTHAHTQTHTHSHTHKNTSNHLSNTNSFAIYLFSIYFSMTSHTLLSLAYTPKITNKSTHAPSLHLTHRKKGREGSTHTNAPAATAIDKRGGQMDATACTSHEQHTISITMRAERETHKTRQQASTLNCYGW